MVDLPAPVRLKRVIITVDSDNLPESTIEYAVTIAARLKRPLEGVFIEDIDLLNSAALPFTREICLTTGLTREIDIHSVLSTYQARMLRFRQRLAQRAEQRSVPWTVSSIRGRCRDYQFDSLEGADFCIYFHASETGQRLHRQHQQMARTVKQLLVLDGGDDNFYQALNTLLLPLEGNQVHLVLVHADVSVAAPESHSISRQLSAVTRLEHRPYSELKDLLQRMGEQLDFVVVSRRQWRSELAPLLARLNCPLIVIG